MTMPMVQESLTTTPITQISTRQIDERYILMGTGSGGNIDDVLPVNTPRLFRSAPPRAAAATGNAITAGIAAEDWSVAFHEAQARSLLNTLDYYAREAWSHVNEEIVFIRVAQTGNAPPTTAQWEAAIASIPQIRTTIPGDLPSFAVVPDYDFLRDAASPYDPTTPSNTVGAIPWLARLASAMQDLGGFVVIGGSAEFTRAEAEFWLARNRPSGSNVVAVFPAVQGSDATAANARSSAPNFVWSVLESEEAGRGAVRGRGTPLNLMAAEGVTGIVPAITQSFGREDTDDYLLEEAGAVVLFNYEGDWVWKTVRVNKDYSTTPADPRTDSVSVRRYLQHLQVQVRLAALQAFRQGLRGDDFFNGVIRRINGVIRRDQNNGLIQSGSAFRLDPAVNPATTARIGYRVAPYYDFESVVLEGHIELPTFAG